MNKPVKSQMNPPRRALLKRLTAGLLATVSVAAGISAASADELSTLKSQLEALSSRVDTIAAQPAAPALPKGASYVTLNRGSAMGGSFDHLIPRGDRIPEERGFTLAITPTADLPAPVHEVTVSGYVKGDVIYDFDGDHGDLFLMSALGGQGKRDHIRLHARQSRFRIKSKSDTAIGQIRTYIEVDFFGGTSGSPALRMRHAWGEWDLSPNWTLGVGQTWSVFMPLIDLPDTIDFFGPAGAAFTRQGQVRLTYRNGPIEARFAIERPRTTGAIAAAGGGIAAAGFGPGAQNVPDFTSQLSYTTPGGHILQLNAVLGLLEVTPGTSGTASSDTEFFYGVIGTAQFQIGEAFLLTLSGGIGDGASFYIDGFDFANNFSLGGKLQGRRYFHADPSISFKMSETVTANVAYGILDYRANDTLIGETNQLQSVHANLLWKPVKQLKMGVEVMYARRKIKGGGHPDAVRGQFGAWFFF